MVLWKQPPLVVAWCCLENIASTKDLAQRVNKSSYEATSEKTPCHAWSQTYTMKELSLSFLVHSFYFPHTVSYNNIYIYIHIYIYVHTYIYIYIYILHNLYISFSWQLHFCSHPPLTVHTWDAVVPAGFSWYRGDGTGRRWYIVTIVTHGSCKDTLW